MAQDRSDAKSKKRNVNAAGESSRKQAWCLKLQSNHYMQSQLHRLFRSTVTAIVLTLPALTRADDPADSSQHPMVNDGSMDSYTLSWSDEFNGTELDASKWDYRTDSKMASTQLPQNVSVSDGTLKLALGASAIPARA